MPTIDQLDIKIYVQYAKTATAVEQINNQFHLPDAASVPPQTRVVDIYPKLTELELLLGVTPFLHKPYAHFVEPRGFAHQRWSPFTFGQIAPLLGPLEKQLKLRKKLRKVKCGKKRHAHDRDALVDCLEEVDEINNQLGFIIGRMGQFLQG